MLPWLVWTVLVAAISLTAFIAVRGRAGRDLGALSVAALVGTAAGNAVGGLIGLDLALVGEFHLVGAIIGAALALGGTAWLMALLAPRGGTR